MLTRELELLTLRLDTGAHSDPSKGVCVMEAVSYIVGEPFSDHPKCACPIITRVAQSVNDRLSDTDRQKLIDYIPRIAGTRSTHAVKMRRMYRAVDLAVRVFAPAALRTQGMTAQAERLEALEEVTSEVTARAAANAAAAAARFGFMLLDELLAIGADERAPTGCVEIVERGGKLVCV